MYLSVFTDVQVDVPDDLDISCLRGSGLQPGEQELPENTTTPEPGKGSGLVMIDG